MRLNYSEPIGTSRIPILVVFIVSIFTPTFHGTFGSTGIAIAYMVSFLIITGIIIIRGGKITLYTSRESAYLSILMACYLWYGIAMLSSAILLSEDLIARDIYDIYRPIACILFSILPLAIVRTTNDLRWLKVALVICLLGTMLFSVNQFMRWSDTVSLLYTKEWNIITGRLSVPFVNPYDLAYFMTLLLPMAITGVLVRKSMSWLLLATLAGLILILTQSRSVMGAAIVQIVIILPVLLISTSKKRRYIQPRQNLGRLKISLMLCIAIAFAVWFWISYSSELGYLIYGFERVLAGQEFGALALRQAQLEETMSRAAFSLPRALFGNGPAKSEMVYVESTYVYFLFRYGVIGFIILFVLPFIMTVCNLTIALKYVRHYTEYILVVGLLAWLIALPVASIGNNFTEQVRISFVYYFSVGLSIRLVTLLRKRV